MMNIIVAKSLHICIIISLGFIFRSGITNSKSINIFKLFEAFYQIIQKVYANFNTLPCIWESLLTHTLTTIGLLCFKS